MSRARFGALMEAGLAEQVVGSGCTKDGWGVFQPENSDTAGQIQHDTSESTVVVMEAKLPQASLIQGQFTAVFAIIHGTIKHRSSSHLANPFPPVQSTSTRPQFSPSSPPSTKSVRSTTSTEFLATGSRSGSSASMSAPTSTSSPLVIAPSSSPTAST